MDSALLSATWQLIWPFLRPSAHRVVHRQMRQIPLSIIDDRSMQVEVGVEMCGRDPSDLGG